ncbi:MAG: type II toxin-antitoxin system RelE/ParE family toxin [Caulobacter sp.]|nr:type II toxin-antitoxin system RelE/ParE family toxin [Caulobacter sp.]
MLPNDIQIEEYLDDSGGSPFGDWFEALGPGAAARVTVALTRIARGAASNVKGVGNGVFEYRIDAGPGYRVYFGRDGDRLVILVGGGTKRRQSRDIEAARMRWANYKARKAASKKGSTRWP